MTFHETTLGNGLRVIAELNPRAYSTAVGFFVRTGARDEKIGVSGVSHFLEHMAFKGDGKYSAEDVNRIFDEIGAKYNASTSEEVTLFYAAILPEYLPVTFDLLAHILRPTLGQDDFDMEKKVILEEIGMYEDLPTFKVYEAAMQTHFTGHPLGQSILGTVDSVSSLTSDQMRAYHRDRYRAGNIVLAVAGNADWEEVVQLAETQCGGWPAGHTERVINEVHPAPRSLIATKDGSIQQHVMQMAIAPTAKSPLRYAAELLTVVVGDDSGSRMFWELVDPGHAETAEIAFNEYDGAGTYTTYVCSQPETTQKNLERIAAIYADVNANGITEQELEQAKSKIASRIVLRSERPMGRLASLGGNWIYREEYRPVEEDMRTYREISLQDVMDLLEAYPLAQTTTTAIGPLPSLNGNGTSS